MLDFIFIISGIHTFIDEILFQYCSVDSSPLSKYVSHPFWNWIVQVKCSWLDNVLQVLVAYDFITFVRYEYCLQLIFPYNIQNLIVFKIKVGIFYGFDIIIGISIWKNNFNSFIRLGWHQMY